VPAELRGRIFDPFFTTSSAYWRRAGSSGCPSSTISAAGSPSRVRPSSHRSPSSCEPPLF